MDSVLSSPGVPVSTILAAARPEFVRELLGESVYELLDLLEGGRATDEHLRRVAAAACDFEALVADPAARRSLIDLLGPAKQAELAFRLDLPDGVEAREALEGATWTKGQQQVMLGFLGLVVDHGAVAGTPDRRRRFDRPLLVRTAT